MIKHIKTLAASAAFVVVGVSTSGAGMAQEGVLGVHMSNQARVIFDQMSVDEGITSTSQKDQILCLAHNIYFEARAESMSGKAAVANVTYNRVKDPRWPNTVCEVVGQGPKRESWKTRQTADPTDAEYYPIRNRCQFSWYCDGARDVVLTERANGRLLKMNARAWQDSVQVAMWASGLARVSMSDNTKGSTFYYNHHLVTPWWSADYTYVGVIGNHTFMK